MDYEKVLKYRSVIERMQVINNKIDNLESSLKKLENVIDKNILIDEEGYNNKKIMAVGNNLVSVSNTIRNSIIPSLNRKMYN